MLRNEAQPRFRSRFTVSLDFELYWGVRDRRTLESYRKNLLGVRDVVPRLLEAFAKSGIHATWATVGFLFFDNKEEMTSFLPDRLPSYKNSLLSPYPYIDSIGENEKQDPFHFGLSLLKQIMSCPDQEVASHTFSHYYCLEEGQDHEDFEADLRSARRAASNIGLELKSLVFPRNQFNPEYLKLCERAGFVAIRGNPKSWMYAPEGGQEPALKRLMRLADAYAPLANNRHTLPLRSEGLRDVPASRFLRPFSRRMNLLEWRRIGRIKREMTLAAENGELYHLWWHPHNFGVDLEENLAVLEAIASHYRILSERHGMQSMTMIEAASC